MRALRVTAEARERLICQRERLFGDMYQSLGDFEAHQQLRESTPQLPHCYLLKKSAHACMRLPEDLTDDGSGPRQGDPCPNNPYTKPENESLLEQFGRFGGIAERSAELTRMHKAGFLTADSISGMEFAAITAVESFGNLYQQEEQERLAEEAKRNRRN